MNKEGKGRKISKSEYLLKFVPRQHLLFIQMQKGKEGVDKKN
jgi:hypothetical protein